MIARVLHRRSCIENTAEERFSYTGNEPFPLFQLSDEIFPFEQDLIRPNCTVAFVCACYGNNSAWIVADGFDNSINL